MISEVLNKPILVRKLPNAGIYFWGENKIMHPTQFDYKMLSNDNKKVLGLFRCHKTNMDLRDDYKGQMLAVDYLTTNVHGKGYGKAFLDFIKHLSNQLGCNGYIVLKSTGMYTPQKIPHLFYRKQGFSTLNNLTDKEMDIFLLLNKKATSKNFRDMLMFYPPASPKTQTSELIGKIKNFFNNLFKF